MSTLPTEPGCYIDANHFSADYLTGRIILFGFDHGWVPSDSTDSIHLTELVNSVVFTDNNWLDSADDSDWLIDQSDRVIHWLNSETDLDSGLYWTIDDNSLYLTEDTETD